MRFVNPLILVATTALCVAWAAGVPSAGVDANADSILHGISSYMAGLKQFSVQTESTIERVTTDGQKIQFVAPGKVTVSRPNKIFAERRDSIADQMFYYDGKSLTLYNPDAKTYSTSTAPGTIDAMLEYAQDKLDVTAPAGDLINSRPYDLLMQNVTSGVYVGLESVGGQRCHHLAYRAADVDWQIWVHDGDRPWPCRYVITSKGITGSPQFSIQTTKFDPAPKIDETMFRFAPPAGATAIGFLPLQQTH